MTLSTLGMDVAPAVWIDTRQADVYYLQIVAKVMWRADDDPLICTCVKKMQNTWERR